MNDISTKMDLVNVLFNTPLMQSVSNRIIQVTVHFYKIDTVDIPQFEINYPFVNNITSPSFTVTFVENSISPTLKYLYEWFKMQVDEYGQLRPLKVYSENAYAFIFVFSSYSQIIPSSRTEFPLPVMVITYSHIFPIMPENLFTLGGEASKVDIIKYTVTFKARYVSLFFLETALLSQLSKSIAESIETKNLQLNSLSMIL